MEQHAKAHHLLRVAGAIVVLALLLAVVVIAAQGLPAGYDQGEPTLTASESIRQVEDTFVVCIVIIGGTALLAGLVWMEKLR